MEGGLQEIFGKVINCGKWLDIVAVKLPDMVFFVNVWEKISINVLLGSFVLVGCVIWERKHCEDKASKNSFIGWWLSYFIKQVFFQAPF